MQLALVLRGDASFPGADILYMRIDFGILGAESFSISAPICHSYLAQLIIDILKNVIFSRYFETWYIYHLKFFLRVANNTIVTIDQFFN